MSEVTETADVLVFQAPKPGMWELETTHHGVRPLSPLLRDAYRQAFEAGTVELVERYGLPLDGVRAEFVHGCLYVRPHGLGEGDKPSVTPPRLLMKLLVRIHPGLRRRNRTAARAWTEKRWRSEVDQWFGHDRAALVERNLELQSVDLGALDDAALAAAIGMLLDHFETQARRNLATHGGDLMPVGDLLAHCETWGVPANDAATLLRGSSPATVETAELLASVARARAEWTEPPASIDELRACDPEVSAAVDAWQRLHAWRLVTTDDVDGPTMAELPRLQLLSLLAAVDPDQRDGAGALADTDRVRDRVPRESRVLFDELVSEARYGMRQREDIRGICWNWSGGLVRRAMLEAGRRLVSRGAAQSVEHAAELSPAELTELLVHRSGPSAVELAARATQRDRVAAWPPPRVLGEVEPPPPLDLLPRPMARATAALMAVLAADVTPPGAGQLRGTGIGTQPYRGRACVVADAADALDKLQQGDVMVAAFTGPSFNSIVPVLGALVVEEGGALCHAAIVARELELAAVVGVASATTLISDGAMVEVDPTSGIVRVLAPSA